MLSSLIGSLLTSRLCVPSACATRRFFNLLRALFLKMASWCVRAVRQSYSLVASYGLIR